MNGTNMNFISQMPVVEWFLCSCDRSILCFTECGFCDEINLVAPRSESWMPSETFRKSHVRMHFQTAELCTLPIASDPRSRVLIPVRGTGLRAVLGRGQTVCGLGWRDCWTSRTELPSAQLYC
jgi:hypothetical protein